MNCWKRNVRLKKQLPLFEKGIDACENDFEHNPHSGEITRGTHIGYSPTGFPLFLPTKLKILFDYRLVILAA